MYRWPVERVTDEVEWSHSGLQWRRWKSGTERSYRKTNQRSILIDGDFFLIVIILHNTVNITCLAMYSSASSTSYFTVLHFVAVISTRDAAWSAFIPCFSKCSCCVDSDINTHQYMQMVYFSSVSDFRLKETQLSITFWNKITIFSEITMMCSTVHCEGQKDNTHSITLLLINHSYHLTEVKLFE